LIDRNEIYRLATELGALLAQTEEVAAYHKAEEILLSREGANDLLKRLRDLQQSVDQSDGQLDTSEAEIDDLLVKWEAIPETAAFEQAQEQVNALLQTVSQMIANRVNQPSDIGN